MLEYALCQLDLIVRIIVSIFCGGAIGYERKFRGKGAGIRTHTIVSVASTLMMIVSHKAFPNADPTRIAAQIVSGIGFLGAGMIFVQGKSVMGLTTAAGIWATSGIGMAIGCGMYVIAIATVLSIVLLQVILHKNHKLLQVSSDEQTITVVIENTEEALSHIQNMFQEKNIHIDGMEISKMTDGFLEIKTNVFFMKTTDSSEFLKETIRKPYVKNISI